MGFCSETVQLSSLFRSVLSAHLHVVGVILQTPCPMVDPEPACGAHKEVRQALSRNWPLGHEPGDARRQISGRREWLWIRQNLRRLQPQLLRMSRSKCCQPPLCSAAIARDVRLVSARLQKLRTLFVEVRKSRDGASARQAGFLNAHPPAMHLQSLLRSKLLLAARRIGRMHQQACKAPAISSHLPTLCPCARSDFRSCLDSICTCITPLRCELDRTSPFCLLDPLENFCNLTAVCLVFLCARLGIDEGVRGHPLPTESLD
jgi:hypothetical protein